MRHLLLILAALCLLAAPAAAQTMKALMYNTNGVVVTGTNALTFTNQINFSGGDVQITPGGVVQWLGQDRIELETYILVGDWTFSEPDYVRGQLGFSTNLNTLWTATNASNARSAAGLGATWLTNTNAENFRTAIGLGETDQATFSEVYVDTIVATTSINNSGNFTNTGNITINQSATTNGLLYIRRTNNEAFLGLANLIASNNTTISNETLFRVGVAEATNRSAQFGFRSTNTNGNGVAVFSVFGFNALMQIGADASTNAVIYSGGGTNNEVMTLIRDGATEFARPLRFSTNASTRPSTNAPANTTNVAAWVEMRIGTNSYRAPLYQ